MGASLNVESVCAVTKGFSDRFVAASINELAPPCSIVTGGQIDFVAGIGANDFIPARRRMSEMREGLFLTMFSLLSIEVRL